MNFSKIPFWIKIAAFYILGFAGIFAYYFLLHHWEIAEFIETADRNGRLSAAFASSVFYGIVLYVPLILGVATLILTSVIMILRMFRRVK